MRSSTRQNNFKRQCSSCSFYLFLSRHNSCRNEKKVSEIIRSTRFTAPNGRLIPSIRGKLIEVPRVWILNRGMVRQSPSASNQGDKPSNNARSKEEISRSGSESIPPGGGKKERIS